MLLGLGSHDHEIQGTGGGDNPHSTYIPYTCCAERATGSALLCG